MRLIMRRRSALVAIFFARRERDTEERRRRREEEKKRGGAESSENFFAKGGKGKGEEGKGRKGGRVCACGSRFTPCDPGSSCFEACLHVTLKHHHLLCASKRIGCISSVLRDGRILPSKTVNIIWYVIQLV